MRTKNLLSRYTVDELREAIRLRSSLGQIEALESKREALLKQVAKIDRKLAKLNGGGSATSGRKVGRKRWKLGPETRRRMSLAAKRRYARKKNAGSPSAPPGSRKRRSMSPETRAKMAVAARKRWAKIKAAEFKGTAN